MKTKRLTVLCLAAPALIATISCGGSSPSPPTSPTPAPTVAPTPQPTPTPLAPLACDPTPPPLHGIKVKVHSDSGFRKTMDSRPLVANIDNYCQRTGQDGRFCFTRLEGHPQQADCDGMAMGIADTGRYGPTWSFDDMPCAEDGSEPGCYHHPSNQFLLIAKGNGRVQACAADDVLVNESRCGACQISETSGECQ
jgi:hypothetical protein